MDTSNENTHSVEHHHNPKEIKSPTIEITTPLAIIIGSVIIALGLVGYGYASRPAGGTQPIAEFPYSKVLKELKINKNAFTACVEGGTETQRVLDSMNDGITAGVNGTPTTFILLKSGTEMKVIATIEGARPFDYMKNAIDEAISLDGKDLSKYKKFNGKTPDETENIEGTGNIYLVEYSDTECPYCMSFHPEITKTRQEFAGKISFVYRHFPLTNIHPHALKEAEMINCAGKIAGNAGYFGFLQKLFDFKIENNVSYLSDLN